VSYKQACELVLAKWVDKEVVEELQRRKAVQQIDEANNVEKGAGKAKKRRKRKRGKQPSYGSTTKE